MRPGRSSTEKPHEEAVWRCTGPSLGQRTLDGVALRFRVGGCPIVGTTRIDALRAFEADLEAIGVKDGTTPSEAATLMREIIAAL